MQEITYSIVEARNNFANLIHQVEENRDPVHVTRRGKPVAVILSMDEFARLARQQPHSDFWASYLAWRKEWNVDQWDLDPDEIWGDVRDKTPAPDVNIWD